MPSDAELQSWITQTRAHRQQLKIVVGVLALLALLVMLSSHKVGFAMLFIAATVAVAGFWILAGHLAEWEGQLSLRRARPRRPRRPSPPAPRSHA